LFFVIFIKKLILMKKLIEQYLDKIAEKVEPEEIDLTSFEIQRTLNPKIWTPEGKLKPEIRQQLLKIADDFLESLEIPWVDSHDVTFTGSLANYNWSEYSDVDLHVLINRSQVADKPELVDEYLAAKKSIWNDEHDIRIYGYEVECYAQDINEEHTSSGVYSVEDDKWLVKPSKEKPQIDKKMVKRKASQIMSKMDDIIELNNKGQHEEVLREYEKLWEKVKTMRQSGLDRAGEFSYENIVFKVLRRTGYIEKLIDTKIDSYDKINSI
jgi:hypothetical protein